MSASTPEPPPSNIPPTEDEPGRRWWWWGLLSGAFHLLILGWVVSLRAPVQDASALAASGREAVANAAPERLEQVAEQINATQADEVRSKLEELQSIEREMAEVRQEKNAQFASLASDLATEAPQKAADAATAAAEAQAQAEKAQAEAVAAAADWKQLEVTAEQAAAGEDKTAADQRANTALGQLRQAQTRAKTAQAAATEAQTRAARQIGFGGTAFKAAQSTQAEANAAQEAANGKQDEAASVPNGTNSLKRLAERNNAGASIAKRAVDLAQGRLDKHLGMVEKLAADIARQQAASDAGQQAVDAAKAQEQQATTDRARADAAASGNRAAQGRAKAQAIIVAEQAKLDGERAEVEKSKASVASAAANAAAALDKAAKAAADFANLPAKTLAVQQEALQAQQNARAAQTRAQSAAAAAAQDPSGQSASLAAGSPPPDPALPTPNLDGKSFAELYALAVQTEGEIASQYKDIRTAETAVQQQIPLADAAGLVQTALPSRPSLDPSLSGNQIQTATDLEAHNTAMEGARAQIDSMVSLARDMASRATGGSSGGVNISSVSDMKAQSAQDDALAQMAAEAPGKDTAIDLTAMMQQIAAGSAASGPSAAASAGQAGAGAGNSTAMPEGNGPQGGIGKNGAPGSGNPGVFGLPPVGAVLDSVPGRRVHASGDGSGTKWMFVDTWYVIGPFPNPQRRNIDTKFPPESVVDLDASYPGKDGRSVRWQFVQATQAAIHPPDEQSYAIYYAYTNLWFDEERDLWIAVGSDDFSKLWINDLMVWASGPTQKTWKPNEGYRKIHFKRGLNRILYRVENGQAACMYSLMLRMDDAPPIAPSS